MRLRLTVTGRALEELIPDLRAKGLRAADLTKPMTKIFTIVLADAEEQVLVSKGALYGGSWAPMAASTVRSGRNPATLLVKSYDLVRSLRRNGPGNIFRPGPKAGVVGSSLPRAFWQQKGTRGRGKVSQTVKGKRRTPAQLKRARTQVRRIGGPGGIPPRPFLLWYEQRFGEFRQILRQFILRGAA